MTQPAFLDEALGLSEAEQAAARNAMRVAGQPSADVLIGHLNKIGIRDQSVLEAALGLSIEDYRRVEAAFRALPAPEPYRARGAKAGASW